MKNSRNYSIIVLLNEKNEIFAQNRKSISKEWEEWWIFWGWLEKWENFEQALTREVKEELNIDIDWDYKYLWKTILELDWLLSEETRIYLVKYDSKYNSNFKVCEWDSGEFLSLDEFKKKKMTSWMYLFIDMIERYFENKI